MGNLTCETLYVGASPYANLFSPYRGHICNNIHFNTAPITQ